MLRSCQRIAGLFVVFLFIEFLDEFVFSILEAAWPLIRDDYALSYLEIGLLLSLPTLAATFIEPVLGILGDVWYRRRLIIGGGVVMALGMLAVALGESYPLLMLAFIFDYPASGAFVSLSQASLMDQEPERHEQNMARWTFAGAIGVMIGPLLLYAAVSLGAGWRPLLGLWAVLAILASLGFARRSRTMPGPGDGEFAGSLWTGFKDALRALRRVEVLRWLLLLEVSDLMLDGLYRYIALYFVDVAGTDENYAIAVVALWSAAGLVGSLLIIPLLERVNGLRYLRWSGLAALLLYPAFLLLPDLSLKVACLTLISITNAGWYSVLQAQVYTALPDKSGTVMTLTNIVGGLPAALIPLIIGWIATHAGLDTAMWLLLTGPLVLLLAVPRR